MSHNYTPSSPTPVKAIPCPDDGDLRSAASVNGAFEKLARAILGEARQPWIPASNVAWETDGTATPTLISGFNVRKPSGTAVAFPVGGGMQFQVVTTASAVAYGYWADIGLWLPDGATISTVTMSLKGAAGHGALPLLMPKFGVWRRNKDFSTGVTSGNIFLYGGGAGTGLVTDASASTAAYQATHDVVFTPDQNAVVDKSAYSYHLTYWNEGHTNAQTGLSIYGFTVALA